MTSVERQLELAKRIIDRLPLCPDHRDKVRGRCLECVNAALLEALETYVAVYRRVMEQANKIDSDVWYAVTKAEQKARAAIAQAKGAK